MAGVLADLGDAALGVGEGGAGALFLAGDLLLRDAMPFKHRAGVGFHFTQRGQGGGRLGGAGGRRGPPRSPRHRQFGFVQCRGGAGAVAFDAGPLHRQ